MNGYFEKSLIKLCEKFRENEKQYKSGIYDEANTRTDFIDEFFKIDKFNKLDGFNADEENFDLNALFNELNVATPNEICINFNKFESIDILHFDDLSKFFSDIWYPSLDDIEIFDINLSFIISVRHYGAIYYFTF